MAHPTVEDEPVKMQSVASMLSGSRNRNLSLTDRPSNSLAGLAGLSGVNPMKKKALGKGKKR